MGGSFACDVVDSDEEDPRIYARQGCDAADVDPYLGDFRDYGDIRDWASASPDFAGPDYPGAEVSATWLPKRVAQFRPTGMCDDLPEDRVAKATRYDPLRRQW